MDVITGSRTPREDAREPISSVSGEKKAEYREYLQTSHWRKTRDAAVRRAGFRCHRCDSKDKLQVHHRTYERLGSERPEDLEVLCSSCHNGHHYDEEVNGARLYMRIVSSVLLRERFESVADLSDAVRSECARLKVPYIPDKVNSAIRTVDANRRGVVGAPPPAPRDPSTWPDRDRPVSHREAVEILRQRLNMKMTFRAIPNAVDLTRRERDIQKALEMVATAMKESQERCAELEATDRPVFGQAS